MCKNSCSTWKLSCSGSNLNGCGKLTMFSLRNKILHQPNCVSNCLACEKFLFVSLVFLHFSSVQASSNEQSFVFLLLPFHIMMGLQATTPPTTIEVETQFMTSSPPAAGVTSPASTVTSPASTKNLLSPSPRKSPLLGFRNHNKNAKNNNTLNIPQEDTDESPKKHVTKFNFS